MPLVFTKDSADPSSVVQTPTASRTDTELTAMSLRPSSIHVEKTRTASTRASATKSNVTLTLLRMM